MNDASEVFHDLWQRVERVNVDFVNQCDNLSQQIRQTAEQLRQDINRKEYQLLRNIDENRKSRQTEANKFKQFLKLRRKVVAETKKFVERVAESDIDSDVIQELNNPQYTRNKDLALDLQNTLMLLTNKFGSTAVELRKAKPALADTWIGDLAFQHAPSTGGYS